jgi:hypothetical protein
VFALEHSVGAALIMTSPSDRIAQFLTPVLPEKLVRNCVMQRLANL